LRPWKSKDSVLRQGSSKPSEGVKSRHERHGVQTSISHGISYGGGQQVGLSIADPTDPLSSFFL
jgi:hypothetical protein